MNAVDSSAWIEYFGDGANADAFAPAIEDTSQLLVPSIVVYEVFKHVLRVRGEAAALSVMTVMKQGRVVDIDLELAVMAARIALDCRLAMADSLILAVVRRFGAILWTQDDDFKAIPEARYFAKSAQ